MKPNGELIVKFIEIAMPRNASHPGLPDSVLINLDGILEVYVRSLLPRETDVRGHEFGLFITLQSRDIRLHGNKSECDQAYKELRFLLNQALSDSEMKGIVGTFTFPLGNEA